MTGSSTVIAQLALKLNYPTENLSDQVPAL